MTSQNPLQGSVISSFEGCNEEVVANIRRYFTIWGNHVLDDPAPLSDEELERHVDRLVFGTWDSDTKPSAPSFDAPTSKQTRLQVGCFTKDLPPATESKTKWQTGLEHEIVDFPENYIAPDVRKAGQPAFVKARLELLEQRLAGPFFFMDRNGSWVPVGFINFGTPGNKLPDVLLAKASSRAENAWVSACEDWNSSLCIYLCRCDIYNQTHANALERQTSPGEHHFRRTSRIHGSMNTSLGHIQRIALLTGKPDMSNIAGFAVFKPRTSDESGVVKSESM